MKKLTISPGCISCGTCQAICPAVFEVKNSTPAQVKFGVDDKTLKANESLVREAAEICPVSAIKIED